MSDESFESLWRHAIREHVRAMPAGELNDLVAQVRPEAADVRASIARKAGQLAAQPPPPPATPRPRHPNRKPQPAPEHVVQQGFTPNRGGGQSGGNSWAVPAQPQTVLQRIADKLNLNRIEGNL